MGPSFRGSRPAYEIVAYTWEGEILHPLCAAMQLEAAVGGYVDSRDPDGWIERTAAKHGLGDPPRPVFLVDTEGEEVCDLCSDPID